jgi:hypothetical protein
MGTTIRRTTSSLRNDQRRSESPMGWKGLSRDDGTYLWGRGSWEDPREFLSGMTGPFRTLLMAVVAVVGYYCVYWILRWSSSGSTVGHLPGLGFALPNLATSDAIDLLLAFGTMATAVAGMRQAKATDDLGRLTLRGVEAAETQAEAAASHAKTAGEQLTIEEGRPPIRVRDD